MALATTTYYPGFGLSSFRSQRGKRWAELVDWVSKLPASDPQVMAMTRTLRRIRPAGHADNHCRDPFCALCATQAVASYPGSEQELIDLYYRHVEEMRHSLRTMRTREVLPLGIPLSAVA